MQVFLLEAAGRGAIQVLSLLLARQLAPRGYGRFSLAMTLLSLAVIVAEMGGPDAAIQRLTGTSDPEGIRPFRSARLTAGVTVSALAAVSTLVLAATGGSSVVALGAVAVLPVVMMQGAVAEARIAERPARATGIGVVSSASLLVGGYAGALLDGSVLAAVTGALATAAVCWGVLLVRGWTGVATPSLSAVRLVASSGAPFLVTALAVTTYTRGDRFFVATFAGVRQLGFYAAAYTIVFAASIAGSAVQVVSFPRLRREFVATGSTAPLIRRILLIAGVGVATSTVLILTRGDLVAALYGSEYSPAGRLVAILAPLVPFYLVNPYLANVLIASNRQGVLSRVAVVNLVIALSCYLVFTALWGVTGTAVGSVLVELSGSCQMLLAVRGAAGRLRSRSGG